MLLLGLRIRKKTFLDTWMLSLTLILKRIKSKGCSKYNEVYKMYLTHN